MNKNNKWGFGEQDSKFCPYSMKNLMKIDWDSNQDLLWEPT